MTLTDFLAHLNTHKSAIEHDLGISRYPYQTLDNWQRLADLFTAAGMTWPATLSQGDILDVGCGKGFLLYEFTQILPGCAVTGLDVSDYAIENAKPEIQACLRPGTAAALPFDNDEFDFVY